MRFNISTSIIELESEPSTVSGVAFVFTPNSDVTAN